MRRKMIWKRYWTSILACCFFGLVGMVIFAQVRPSGGEGQNVEGTALAEADGYSRSLCLAEPSAIPGYQGESFVVLNGNVPCFNTYDLQYVQGESYSPLDELGRCGTAVAMLHRSLMPQGEREEIGMIRPTGFVQAKYPGLVDSEPPYLYNRCHLIAYAMTGQNANECNLITGTRYLNAETMLPWEKKVLQYLDACDHHVLYRVTPYFKEKELVARGVELEAYSVEDRGAGLCFHVFVYNVQPGVEIDYQTGESKKIE